MALEATTIPNTSYGKELTIIADVNNVLYFRVFDPAGMKIMDTDETKLPAKAADIAALKAQVKALTAYGYVLTPEERTDVKAKVRAIVGLLTPPA